MSEYMKLGDVCVFYSGTGFPSEYQGKIKGKFPFYKVGDISKNVMLGYKFLTFCDNYIDLIVAEKIKGVIVPSDTVVFAKIGEALRLNRRGITICDCLIDNNVMGIKPKTNYLNIGYFYYWMCNLDLQKYSESTTVPSVRKTRIEKIDILVPNIAEQLKIANTLDKVTALIDKHKKQLEKLDKLVQARFVEMFGDPVINNYQWDTKKLFKITEKIGSGATPRGGKESYQDYGISLVRSMNVHNGFFDYKELAHITDAQAEQLNNVCVKENDVFINITGASVARSCVAPNDILPARVNQHVSIIRCKAEMVNHIFINNIFLNKAFKNLLIEIGESGGATRQAITKQQLEQLLIIIPPIELQNQFADFVKQVEKTKTEVQKSLEQAEILKKALMQKYFG